MSSKPRIMPNRVQVQQVTEMQRGALVVPCASHGLWRVQGVGPGERSGLLREGDLVHISASADLSGGVVWAHECVCYWRAGLLCAFPGDAIVECLDPQREGLADDIFRPLAAVSGFSGRIGRTAAMPGGASSVLSCRGGAVVVVARVRSASASRRT